MILNAPNLRLFHKAGNRLGEGVFFDAARHSIHWVDIPNRKICKLDDSHRYSELQINAEPGFLVVTEAGHLLVGADQEILLIDDDTIIGHAAIDCVHSETSVNDGSVSPDGKFLLFGTKHKLETEKLGESFIVADEIFSAGQRFAVFNGPAFGLDGARVYFTDSPTRTIQVADFQTETGGIANVREFVWIPDDEGYPDGMAIDSEGCLWNAQWNGARITRYLPDGSIDKIYKLPVARPTSLAFAGDDLKTVIVTSAALDATASPCQPNEIQDGDLLAFDVDVPGVALPAYSGSIFTNLRE